MLTIDIFRNVPSHREKLYPMRSVMKFMQGNTRVGTGLKDFRHDIGSSNLDCQTRLILILLGMHITRH